MLNPGLSQPLYQQYGNGPNMSNSSTQTVFGFPQQLITQNIQPPAYNYQVPYHLRHPSPRPVSQHQYVAPMHAYRPDSEGRLYNPLGSIIHGRLPVPQPTSVQPLRTDSTKSTLNTVPVTTTPKHIEYMNPNPNTNRGFSQTDPIIVEDRESQPTIRNHHHHLRPTPTSFSQNRHPRKRAASDIDGPKTALHRATVG